MPVSVARAAAFDILLRVAQEDAYASELLHSSAHAGLSSADHGLATELTMGVLRWRSLLDSRIAKHSSQSLQKLDIEVLTALRLAAYQLRFLPRVPQRAAVHESVEMVKRSRKRSAAGFVNAVLRKLAESGADAGPTSAPRNAEELAAAYSHPPWLVERWVREYGFARSQSICDYDQKVPQACVYLSNPALEEEFHRSGIELTADGIVTRARRVESGDVTHTAAVREGRVSIQDEASQLVALLVGKGQTILDCCAAPGGKTRLIAGRNPQATVLAVDLHAHRARLLRRLVLDRNVMVIAADVLALPTNRTFDRVLVDVPCSGTGTLARNPEIKWRLQLADLLDLQARQIALVQAAMQFVSPGGRLLYSTCSLEPEENAQVVERSVGANAAFRILDCRVELEHLRTEGEITGEDLSSILAGPYLRTVPGVQPWDGFFAAILGRL